MKIFILYLKNKLHLFYMLLFFGCMVTQEAIAQVQFPNVRVNDVQNVNVEMDATKALAYFDGTIYVVWSDLRNGPNQNLFFSKSADGGLTFSADVNVCPAFTADYHVFASIAVDINGIIHVAWTHVPDGTENYNIWYTKSTDGGETFLDPTEITTANGYVFPSIATFGNNVYIFYAGAQNYPQADYYFVRSTDQGDTFNSAIQINDAPGTGTIAFEGLTSMDVDNSGNIYLAWVDGRRALGQGDIYFAKSTNSGVSFSSNVMVNDINSSGVNAVQYYPKVSAETDSEIVVAFTDKRLDEINGSWESNRVYISKSLNQGLNFSPEVLIANHNGLCKKFDLDIKQGKLGVVLSTHVDPDGWGAWYLESEDGGVTFSAPVALTDSLNPTEMGESFICLDSNGNAYAIWMDNREGNLNIYFSKRLKPIVVESKIIGYEYAFNQGENLQFVNVTPTENLDLNVDINVSGLTNALNVFHIRFKDNSGKWSAIKSHLFMTLFSDATSAKQIVGYEYAFNNGQNLQYVPTTPSTDFNLLTAIDVSSLTNALNVLHIRFKDNTGKWSAMKSHLFMTQFSDVSSNKQIVGYEYAFNNQQGLQYVPVTPSTEFNLLSDIDVSSLTNALNVLHIRFKDNTGKWSAMKSHLFMTQFSDVTSNKQIVGYEYAFNQGQNLQYVPVTPSTDFNLLTDLDVSNLTNALNVLHIRFKDNTGKWSVMKSHLFAKPYLGEETPDNTIVQYNYWFNNDVNNKYTMNVNPVNPLILTELNMNELWEGDYDLHTQYKDAYGKYSLVTTHTVHKNANPVASFISNDATVCLGESISFDGSSSVDYDTVLYDFGDGQSSTDLNTTHTYTTAGNYTVTLTVTHTLSGLTDVSSKNMVVSSYPLATITSSEATFPACYGTTVQLTADAIGANYLWSTGATTRSIDVTTAGDYSVTVSNAINEDCSVVSDPISVSYKSEIDHTVTLQNWPLLLTANEVGATYQWIDCSNGNMPIEGATQVDYEPTVNGDYAVEVTKNGCTVTSECTTIGTVDIADFSIKKLVKIFPNPVNDFVNISNDIPIRMIIYNVNGMKIMEKVFETGLQNIDMSYFSSGLYLTKIIALSGEWENSHALYRLIRE